MMKATRAGLDADGEGPRAQSADTPGDGGDTDAAGLWLRHGLLVRAVHAFEAVRESKGQRLARRGLLHQGEHRQRVAGAEGARQDQAEVAGGVAREIAEAIGEADLALLFGAEPFL